MVDVNRYLEQCDELINDIDKVIINLDNANDINSLNVTEQIVEIVKEFKSIKNINRVELTEEELTKIDKKNDLVKNKIREVKNKQIALYNFHVERINEKINGLKRVSSLLVHEDVRNLKTLKLCYIRIDEDWQKNSYKNYLNYDKLVQTYEELEKVEEKHNIQHNEPADLTVKLNYYVQLLEDTKKEIKEDMTLTQVTNLLDKCMDVYKNIIDLDICVRMAYEKGIIDKDTYAKYNGKTTSISNNVSKITVDLLKKKKDVNEFANDYTYLADKLAIVQLQSLSLESVMNKYHGECNSAILNRFKVCLGKLNLQLKAIENESKTVNLNSQQTKLLFGEKGKIEQIRLGLKRNYNKLNNDPHMLGSNLDLHINNLMKQLENEIKDLNILVDKFQKGDDREEINQRIENIKKSVANIEKYLSNTNKVQLKNELNVHEAKFNKVCKEYNKKCPLLVKKVKPANNVYKKYKKECLEIAGLSSFALLDNPTLIPTIMHGNIVLQQKLPILKKFTNFVNNVLGGVINAKKNENDEWTLSNGYKIGPAIACNSLLKNMALSDSKLVSSALVQKVRNLTTKMSISFNNAKVKMDRRRLERDFERSGDSVEEYVNNNNLSETERKLLEANYEYRQGRSRR